jgi:hypothetical protein
MIEAAVVLPFILFFTFSALDLLRFAYNASIVQYYAVDVIDEVALKNMSSAEAKAFAQQRIQNFGLGLTSGSEQMWFCILDDNTPANAFLTPACEGTNSIDNAVAGDIILFGVNFDVNIFFRMFLPQNVNYSSGAIAIQHVER